jgi:hypothetical protein
LLNFKANITRYRAIIAIYTKKLKISLTNITRLLFYLKEKRQLLIGVYFMTEQKINPLAQVQSYVGALELAAKKTKVSELNFQDINAVVLEASRGVNDKIEGAKVNGAYNTLFMRLHSAIKIHLNHMNEDYEKRVGLEKAMAFENPAMYLSDSDGKRTQVSPSDPSLSYLFLMTRIITKDNARQLLPHFKLSFGKDALTDYQPIDVIKSFKYSMAGQDLDIYLTGNNKRSLNEQVKEMFQDNAKEVNNIVKNIFNVVADQCNTIKEATEIQAVTACQADTHITSPDFFINMLTCLEVFNLAKQPTYCPELQEEEVHLEFDF